MNMKQSSLHALVAAVAILSLLPSIAMIAAKPPVDARPHVAPEKPGEAKYRRQIQPLFKRYCYSCHGGGSKSGGVSLDAVQSYNALIHDRPLFRKVLRNLRSGTMPPLGMEAPKTEEKAQIEHWIKTSAFGIDPANPDPGSVTVRRLNRAEYRATVRDLLGVDYDTQTEFPADDAGHGFDNIGEVLTISPMLMEKYLNAAQAIISLAVPVKPRVVAETSVPGSQFLAEGAPAAAASPVGVRSLSYYDPITVSHSVQVDHPGRYQLVLDLSANERYVDKVFDYNRCRLIVRADGQELLRKEFNREGGKRLQYLFDQTWQTGAHKLSFELEPLTPGVIQVRSLSLRILNVTVRGPFDSRFEVEPQRYRSFFPRPAPTGALERRTYARTLLADFARRAFRRPADPRSGQPLSGPTRRHQGPPAG